MRQIRHPFARLAALATLLWLQTSLAHVTAQGAQAPRAKIDVAKLGPQVGQLVPDFSLKDQSGKTWTRNSIMGPKGAMLVFYRSADWCPYCKTQLVDLQSRLDTLRAQGLGVAAISYDPVPTLTEFASRRHITFPLLADEGSEIGRAHV